MHSGFDHRSNGLPFIISTFRGEVPDSRERKPFRTMCEEHDMKMASPIDVAVQAGAALITAAIGAGAVACATRRQIESSLRAQRKQFKAERKAIRNDREEERRPANRAKLIAAVEELNTNAQLRTEFGGRGWPLLSTEFTYRLIISRGVIMPQDVGQVTEAFLEGVRYNTEAKAANQNLSEKSEYLTHWQAQSIELMENAAQILELQWGESSA
jgi:hypothetical protein